MAEEWRPVPGYEGLYEVSNYGRVRSLDRYVHTPRGEKLRRITYGVVLRQTPKDTGRLMVTLCKEGRKAGRQVHQLVAQAFAGPKPSAEHEVCHNDGNHLNNHASNLRWGTRLENAQDRVMHEAMKRARVEVSGE